MWFVARYEISIEVLDAAFPASSWRTAYGDMLTATAVEWGASFGYPRLGSVVAEQRTRLFALPSETLNELMREVPALDREIRRVVRTRLYEPVEAS